MSYVLLEKKDESIFYNVFKKNQVNLLLGYLFSAVCFFKVIMNSSLKM